MLESINVKYNELGFEVAVWVQLFCTLYFTLTAVINTPLNLIGYGNGTSIKNWLTAFIWIGFVNVLNRQNLLMKSTMVKIVSSIDKFAIDPRCPVPVKQAWEKAKLILDKKPVNKTA